MSFVSRRKFLLTAGVATAGALAFAEHTFIREPNHPEVVRIEMPLRRLPPAFDGFTIVQLSDFHYDRIFTISPIERAIKLVNEIHPDLIVLTGDFVTVPLLELRDERQWAAAAEPCAELLQGLHSRLGSLAVLGNHDVSSDPAFITAALQAHGIPVLRNACHLVEENGARLWFCGLDSMDRKPDIERAFQRVPNNEAVVLLVHEPDFADIACRYPLELQLSGHSHGGQVWIPGFGAPWLPTHARKYPRGLYEIQSLRLYTNIGLGTIRVPMRLNCVPEVTLFTLRAGG